MTFTAPADAVLVGRCDRRGRTSSGNDLQPVAVWVLHAGQRGRAHDHRSQMEAYSGAPDQWEAQFESQTHWRRKRAR